MTRKCADVTWAVDWREPITTPKECPDTASGPTTRESLYHLLVRSLEIKGPISASEAPNRSPKTMDDFYLCKRKWESSTCGKRFEHAYHPRCALYPALKGEALGDVR